MVREVNDNTSKQGQKDQTVRSKMSGKEQFALFKKGAKHYADQQNLLFGTNQIPTDVTILMQSGNAGEGSSNSGEGISESDLNAQFDTIKQKHEEQTEKHRRQIETVDNMSLFLSEEEEKNWDTHKSQMRKFFDSSNKGINLFSQENRLKEKINIIKTLDRQLNAIDAVLRKIDSYVSEEAFEDVTLT